MSRFVLDFDELRRVNFMRCTTPKPDGFNHPLDKWSALEWGGACAGEIGEACNVAKKLLRFRDDLAGNSADVTKEQLMQKLAQEICDGIIYADLWCASQGIDLGQSVIDTFNAKSEELGMPFRLGMPHEKND